MKRLSWVPIVVLVAAVALPVFAGEKEHSKCTSPPEECLKKMQQKISNKAWLGIEMDATKDGRWRITRVVPDSPAARAGFAEGDVLLAMNGYEYADTKEGGLKQAWSEVEPGSDATYVVLRQGEKVTLHATLGHVPDEIARQWIAEHMEKAHGDVKLAQNAD
jgi:predicted metalloprotease with PDZ domain